MALLKRQEQICRELRAKDNLLYSLRNQVNTLDEKGQSQESTEIGKRDIPDCHDHRDLEMTNQIDETSFKQIIEPLARAIHVEYLAHVKPDLNGRLPPTAVPWDALPEDFRESNRDQARDICQKLWVLNCRIVSKTMGADRAVTTFNDEQIELLAQMEHDRWVEEKQRNGWVVGTPRDNEKRVHPDLIPWDELDEAAKEKDRNAVRMIPKLLGDSGFAIYPMP